MAEDELCREKTAEAEVHSFHWTRLSHPETPAFAKAGMHQLQLGGSI
ncbi:MAG: hypothetical protein ACXV7G_10055 [Halobacteriota archaeon]